jgi:hypothetical protein
MSIKISNGEDEKEKHDKNHHLRNKEKDDQNQQ